MAKYKIYSVEGNRQRLDGGAMFGNVPHAVWSKWIAPDERMRIPLACRAFLIHHLETDRRILLDAGIGCAFAPKLRDRFGVHEASHRLLENLAARGVQPEQIDAVILSHLHFDHAGGLLSAWREDNEPELVFPSARVIVHRRAWKRAIEPHARDRASFLPALNSLLEQSGRLELIGESMDLLGKDFSSVVSDGHTPGLLLTSLTTEEGGVVFCGDLIPGAPWVHLPVTMGYDRFPELLIDEKTSFVEQARQKGRHLLFTHDPNLAACKVERGEKGKYRATDGRAELDGLEL